MKAVRNTGRGVVRGAGAPQNTPRRAHGDRVTLARAISKLGFSSRSRARAMVEEGRVCVNGRIARSPDVWIDPRHDRISVDGKNVRPSSFVVYMIHKPAGIVTTRSDERDRRTIYDLLPKNLPWVFPVGRLDRESSGLLLLTNDTRLGETVTSPLNHCPKTYEVGLDRPLTPESLEILRRGMTIADGTILRGIRVRSLGRGSHSYEFVLTEGKNRQIRRMCAELGYSVQKLHRLAIGSLCLGDLAEGSVRTLKPYEVQALLPPL